jgi:hypothetical protein
MARLGGSESGSQILKCRHDIHLRRFRFFFDQMSYLTRDCSIKAYESVAMFNEKEREKKLQVALNNSISQPQLSAQGLGRVIRSKNN